VAGPSACAGDDELCSFSIATILASVTWPYAAEQQYYVFDYGNRVAALWLDR
jgi:hypothetical protein